MLARRGPTIFELDRHASTADTPHLIYTADCSDPHEIDDGLLVEGLPVAQETYRVTVCVADTSKLYAHPEVRKKAMEQVHADYWDLANGERGYDPMIDPEVIKNLELTKGNVRTALMVSFLVGKDLSPSDAEIKFGRVEVTKNYDYKQFSEHAAPGGSLHMYSRASQFILSSLNFRLGGDSVHHPPQDKERTLQNISYASWKRGARMNETFMVAANHLVGKILRDEGYPAIYRVHDLNGEAGREIVEADVALYTQNPGPHFGLGVDPYCRVTSPLRRLEDFIMNHLLHLRYQGLRPSQQDVDTMSQAIRNLNRRAIYENELSSLAKIRQRREVAGRISGRTVLRTLASTG